MSTPIERATSERVNPAVGPRTRYSGVRGALSLLGRAVVLFGLIAWAAGLYAKAAAVGRGIWPGNPARSARGLTRFSRAFVRTATRYRGGLIKIGQVASLRVDVMPEEITEELARLQDRVAPHPFEEIAAQLSHELGPAWRDRFDRFSAKPVASASLGQVHAVTAHDGRRLAVKILYPGVERSVAVDLAMVRFGLWLFNFVFPADLRQVYREVRDSLLGEMDYVREGQAAEEIAGNLAQVDELEPHLRVPTIDWSTTTRRVLTMEFIDGVKINDRDSVEELGFDMEALVKWSTRAFLHMMFHDGFFHCDPHPGNLLVDRQGRVVIIDFGMNKRVDLEVLAALRDNVIATVTRDSELFADSLVQSEMVRPRDREAVRELALLSFDDRYYNLTPSELAQLDFAEYFQRIRGQMKRIPGFQLPDGIVMWSRALSLLYGLAVELAPGIRPLDIVGPFVLDFLRRAP